MQDASTDVADPDPAVSATDAVKVQILATEHWSLLATRSMIWNEIFARAGTFLTTLSAAVVALALVAQATDFGPNFRLFALLVLPVVLLLGVGTFVRLGVTMREEIWLVIGMNRLRHGYLDVAPDLEPYFVMSHFDDLASVMRIDPAPGRFWPLHIISSTPAIVGIINSVLVGVIVALLVGAVDDRAVVYVSIGTVAALIAGILLVGVVPYREIGHMQRTYQPRFPR